MKVGMQFDSATAEPAPEFVPDRRKNVQSSLVNRKNVGIGLPVPSPYSVLSNSEHVALVDGKARLGLLLKLVPCEQVRTSSPKTSQGLRP
jgi:hypothetical protein